LVVIGVHTPEFSIEHDVTNVRRATAEMQITYPVAVDSDYAIWQGFNNQYWPALYLLGGDGRVQYSHFGEGAYDESERAIQQVLMEAHARDVGPGLTKVEPRGAEVAADWTNVKSPESYVGYAKTEWFASPGGAVADRQRVYLLPTALPLNHWALEGDWTMTQGAHSASSARRAHRVLLPRERSQSRHGAAPGCPRCPLPRPARRAPSCRRARVRRR
jgi:hypothetical protein